MELQNALHFPESQLICMVMLGKRHHLLVLISKTEMEGIIRQRYIKGQDTSQVGFANHLSCLHRPGEAFHDILDKSK